MHRERANCTRPLLGFIAVKAASAHAPFGAAAEDAAAASPEFCAAFAGAAGLAAAPGPATAVRFTA